MFLKILSLTLQTQSERERMCNFGEWEGAERGGHIYLYQREEKEWKNYSIIDPGVLLVAYTQWKIFCLVLLDPSASIANPIWAYKSI